LVKSSTSSAKTAQAVRTRRAYFDLGFGQLHVRTAFPTTGGFDEQMTLFCLHPQRSSSRLFARFLPQIADVRSVYAPDFPGHGESDPLPVAGIAEACQAICALADDLRLRQIDVLGLGFGASVAVQLAATRAQLVRRLVLAGLTSLDHCPAIKHEVLVLRGGQEMPTQLAQVKIVAPNSISLDMPQYADERFESSPQDLATPIGAYLSARS
jgi:pimeloyl-ACP methyl ester carboxylesterase